MTNEEPKAREWWATIEEMSESREQATESLPDTLKEGLIPCCFITKSAYDALAKRVESAENYVKACASSKETMRIVDELSAAKTRVGELERELKNAYPELDKQLAAAKAEIERLKEFEYMYEGLNK